MQLPWSITSIVNNGQILKFHPTHSLPDIFTSMRGSFLIAYASEILAVTTDFLYALGCLPFLRTELQDTYLRQDLSIFKTY